METFLQTFVRSALHVSRHGMCEWARRLCQAVQTSRSAAKVQLSGLNSDSKQLASIQSPQPTGTQAGGALALSSTGDKLPFWVQGAISPALLRQGVISLTQQHPVVPPWAPAP